MSAIPNRKKHRIGAWALLFCPDTGRFLFGRRSPWLHNGGYWSLFGGRSDKGETPGDTLLRELEEEIGVRFTADHLTSMGDIALDAEGPDKPARTLHFFLIRCPAEFSPALNLEHSEARWMLPDALPKGLNRPTTEALRQGLFAQASRR